MLCVVLGHVVAGYIAGNTYEQANTVMRGIFAIIYVFHMPLFMMISGYVYSASYLSEKKANGKERLCRQIWNCIAVYVLYSVCFGAFKLIFSAFVNDRMKLADILLIWVKPISPYWYLYDLILFYIIFSHLRVRRMNCHITFCLLLVVSMASHWVVIDWFEIYGLCHYALFFYIGMYIDGRAESGRRSYKALSAFVVAAILLEVVCWYGGMNGSFEMRAVPVLSVLVAGVISLALWYLFRRIRVLGNNPFLMMIGRHSLEIYVIHCFFTAGLRAVLPRIGVGNAWVSIILNMAVSTALPILFSMLCRYMRIYDLFFRPVTFFKAYASRQ